MQCGLSNRLYRLVAPRTRSNRQSSTATDSPTYELLRNSGGIIAPAPIHIECEAFTGPLEALFLCFREGKINLLEIPLAPICESYFSYVLSQRGNELDEVSSALVALSFLLERKAWALLPSAEPEPDAAEVEDLVLESQLATFYDVIEVLEEFMQERSKLFFRNPDPSSLPVAPVNLVNIRPGDLAKAFERVINRAVEEPAPLKMKPRRQLGDVIALLVLKLTADFQEFESFLDPGFAKIDVVYTFLGFLELLRLGQAELSLSEDVLFFRKRQ